ncbi:hypothetical protein GCM10017690_21090 [Microbacterium terregens]
MSDFDRFSLTIARWLTNVYDVDTTAENYTTPGDVTLEERATWNHRPIDGPLGLEGPVCGRLGSYGPNPGKYGSTAGARRGS